MNKALVNQAFQKEVRINMGSQHSDMLEMALDICSDVEYQMESTAEYKGLMNHLELIKKRLNPDSNEEINRLLDDLDEVYTNLYNMQLIKCTETLISEACVYDEMTR